jgi:hypothetical protein
MGAAGFSKTSVTITRSTWSHVPEGTYVSSHRRENLMILLVQLNLLAFTGDKQGLIIQISRVCDSVYIINRNNQSFISRPWGQGFCRTAHRRRAVRLCVPRHKVRRKGSLSQKAGVVWIATPERHLISCRLSGLLPLPPNSLLLSIYPSCSPHPCIHLLSLIGR